MSSACGWFSRGFGWFRPRLSEFWAWDWLRGVAGMPEAEPSLWLILVMPCLDSPCLFKPKPNWVARSRGPRSGDGIPGARVLRHGSAPSAAGAGPESRGPGFEHPHALLLAPLLVVGI